MWCYFYGKIERDNILREIVGTCKSLENLKVRVGVIMEKELILEMGREEPSLMINSSVPSYEAWR